MIIKNKELRDISVKIQKIVDIAIKEAEDLNKKIESFNKKDLERQKEADKLKAERWQMLKKIDLGLKEFEVITELKPTKDGLDAVIENMFESWKENFYKTRKEQDETSKKVLKKK